MCLILASHSSSLHGIAPNKLSLPLLLRSSVGLRPSSSLQGIVLNKLGLCSCFVRQLAFAFVFSARHSLNKFCLCSCLTKAFFVLSSFGKIVFNKKVHLCP